MCACVCIMHTYIHCGLFSVGFNDVASTDPVLVHMEGTQTRVIQQVVRVDVDRRLLIALTAQTPLWIHEAPKSRS